MEALTLKTTAAVAAASSSCCSSSSSSTMSSRAAAAAASTTTSSSGRLEVRLGLQVGGGGGFRAELERRSWNSPSSNCPTIRRKGRRRRKVTAQAQASFDPLDFPLRASTAREREHEQRVALPRLQDLDPNTMLLRQRVIFLGGQVDDFSADVIISQMLLLDAQDPTQDIKLFINSPGGSVTAGMGIYDAMKLCRADVSTTCFGLAASMGAFLLAAGMKGKRYSMPNARIMIHQPLGGAQGTAIEVGLQVREMMYHKKKLGKIMARLTGQTDEQIDIDTDRDNFMNAWEAVEYGLVDHVIDDGKPGLVAPLGEIKAPPRSRIWDSWTVKEGKDRKALPTEEKDFYGGRKFGDRKEDEVEQESKEQEQEKAAAV